MDNGASSYRRFLDGDDAGFTELVRDYKDGLIFYLNSLVHDLSAAEELAEDTFVKLGVKRPRLRDTASFKTWLYTIGRHLAIDYLRRAARVNTEPLEDHPDLADSTTLEHTYLRQERKIMVHRVMARLKPEYRQVLWLIYFEELTGKQAAKIMGKSVHNIETLAYRARQALRSELRREGFQYEDL